MISQNNYFLKNILFYINNIDYLLILCIIKRKINMKKLELKVILFIYLYSHYMNYF